MSDQSLKKQILLSILFLIILAGFLRYFRISELTEFLGDQGRTGIVIYDAWNNKTIPLAGPTVLTGQHLGPFFYYLIAPAFILFNFNPIGSALFTAIIGVLTVLLMFHIGYKLFGFWIGGSIATLYAVSPSIIASDRIVWEPNVIPFFILLFIFAIYNIFEEKNFKLLFPLGAILGILVQLHYPNIFLILLAFILWTLFMRKRNKTISYAVIWTILGILGFVFVLFPFIIFELQNKFQDIKELSNIFSSNSNNLLSLSTVNKIFDLSNLSFRNIFPINKSVFFSLLQILVIILPFLRRNFWHIFFTFWFIGGTVAFSFYKDIIFPHYLNFLIPIPFLLFGFFIETLTVLFERRDAPSDYKNILIIFVLLLALLNLSKTDILSKGNNDLYRLQIMTDEVINQSGGQPFSFTLISTRSFSDLHFRYYFKLKHIDPVIITDNSYSLLFLICEADTCPTLPEMEGSGHTHIVCYEPHCKWEYPDIKLTPFRLEKVKDVFGGRIFTYKRE